MNGDFSRYLFDLDRSLDYTGVLMQQGRVLVDAEWNELCALINEQIRTAIADLTAPDRPASWSLSGTVNRTLVKDDTGAPCVTITIKEGTYYVAGVRVRWEQKESTSKVPVHPKDQPLAASDRIVVSAHAWERTVSPVEDEDAGIQDWALQGADSALRTKVTWALQVDTDKNPAAKLADWPDKFRGKIKSIHHGHDSATPSLYRVEITRDGVAAAGVEDAKRAWFAWARNNPTIVRLRVDNDGLIVYPPDPEKTYAWIELLTIEDLQSGRSGKFFFNLRDPQDRTNLQDHLRQGVAKGKQESPARFWDGYQPATLPADDSNIKLDTSVEIAFDKESKYRRGEFWLLAYRGEKPDTGWQLPSGQHYFALVATSVPAVDVVDTGNETDQESAIAIQNWASDVGTLVDKVFPSSSQTRRAIAARPLADETTNTWLQNWLSTALLSEVVSDDFDGFWGRLTAPLADGMLPDKDLQHEARKIWDKARKLDLAIKMAKPSRLRTLT